jgi:hypothetical protein
MAGQGGAKAERYRVRQGKAGKARHGLARRVKGFSCPGKARLGKARQARQGRHGIGSVQSGLIRLVMAELMLDKARQA